MQIINLENATKVPLNLDGKIMYSSSNIEIVHLTLNEGEELPQHDNPFDVIFYVLSGEGILTIENEEVKIKTNSCFEVKSGKQRGWKNYMPDKLKILVIKKL